MAYRGGIQKNFQRAESASYFGREIGIMYMHAHLRYCEALARHGDSERFFEALIRINPIAMREIIPSGRLAPGELLLLQFRSRLCRPI
jgi:1,2-beta-oligoglucan phosphorylase